MTTRLFDLSGKIALACIPGVARTDKAQTLFIFQKASPVCGANAENLEFSRNID